MQGMSTIYHLPLRQPIIVHLCQILAFGIFSISRREGNILNTILFRLPALDVLSGLCPVIQDNFMFYTIFPSSQIFSFILRDM